MQVEQQDDFFEIRFEQIMKHLFTGQVIPIVQKLLQGRNIRVDDIAVRAVGQTVLHQLRAKGRVTQPTADMYEQLKMKRK